MDVRETFASDPDVDVLSATPGWIHLHIRTSIGLIERLGKFVREVIVDVQPGLSEELGLAVDELLSNSMEHGCRLDAECAVEFKIIRTARVLIFQIKDGGIGFSMDDMAHAAVNNPPEEPLRHTQLRDEMGMRPGGFGLLLVKKIADELIYNEQGNEVALVKYLSGV